MSSNIFVSFALAAGVALPIGVMHEDTSFRASDYKAQECEVSTDKKETIKVPCIVNVETGKRFGVG
ncbi:predicted protein [Cyanophage PSS2]|uniref:hypothetical protein n=1 Tax=Cyanophage PSS2 TaxID=658401 RepID=UPI0001B04037|nr:hypothetical protein PSS2_gp096 [Cyanophage PSS2]ACT65658.1 hypothetical protein [Cyanophage PSS2]ACY75799.1 predicted protein [Cyanophage PSS2]